MIKNAHAQNDAVTTESSGARRTIAMAAIGEIQLDPEVALTHLTEFCSLAAKTHEGAYLVFAFDGGSQVVSLESKGVGDVENVGVELDEKLSRFVVLQSGRNTMQVGSVEHICPNGPS